MLKINYLTTNPWRIQWKKYFQNLRVLLTLTVCFVIEKFCWIILLNLNQNHKHHAVLLIVDDVNNRKLWRSLSQRALKSHFYPHFPLSPISRAPNAPPPNTTTPRSQPAKQILTEYALTRLASPKPSCIHNSTQCFSFWNSWKC